MRQWRLDHVANNTTPLDRFPSCSLIDRCTYLFPTYLIICYYYSMMLTFAPNLPIDHSNRDISWDNIFVTNSLRSNNFSLSFYVHRVKSAWGNNRRLARSRNVSAFNIHSRSLAPSLWLPVSNRGRCFSFRCLFLRRTSIGLLRLRLASSMASRFSLWPQETLICSCYPKKIERLHGKNEGMLSTSPRPLIPARGGGGGYSLEITTCWS